VLAAVVGQGSTRAEAQAGSQAVPPPQVAVPPAQPAADAEDYKVGPRDVLRIEMPRDAATFPTRPFPVEIDGTISFWPTPSLIRLQVSNLTTRQIEQLIKDGLKHDGLVMGDATVIVTIDQFKSKTFFMSGEVAKPGQTVLQLLRVTLLQALAEAGGVTAQAGPDVMIRRHRDPTVIASVDAKATDDPSIETLVFNRDDLMAGRKADPVLQEGDTVVVPKARTVLVNGEVRTPKAVTWVEGLTIMQALTAAGGATDKAATNRIYIERMNPKTKKLEKITKDIKLTTPVQADDTIVVPKKYFG
jgi:protein involved in polysaccharide export with SLBB domain